MSYKTLHDIDLDRFFKITSVGDVLSIGADPRLWRVATNDGSHADIVAMTPQERKNWESLRAIEAKINTLNGIKNS